ncbi:Rhs-family protein, partial [hydrothermal vent metagenome]
LWADNHLIQETRNNLKKTYVYEPHSFRPVALVQDEQIYHYHLDHLGTPRELTNAQVKIVWRVKYKTYGNVALKEVKEIKNNLRFQGQYYDEETGLHYNRHRYYNPDTGQFINPDPIGLWVVSTIINTRIIRRGGLILLGYYVKNDSKDTKKFEVLGVRLRKQLNYRRQLQ